MLKFVSENHDLFDKSFIQKPHKQLQPTATTKRTKRRLLDGRQTKNGQEEPGRDVINQWINQR